MDTFMNRVLKLNDEDRTLLREDVDLLNHMQQANRMVEDILRRQKSPNASFNLHSRRSSNNNNTSGSNYTISPPSDRSHTAIRRTSSHDALDLTIQPRPLAAVAANNNNNSNGTTTTASKKYIKDFDEPNVDEINKRMKTLVRRDSYHMDEVAASGDCACVLGSEFADRTTSSVLEMVEQWRTMTIEERLAFKWDMNDLPKDIPLSDIKRFENLRREGSGGCANFGGVGKRKPLGIRGTRQLLLILYCVWGHPGREHEMQREGYCPHCFARIKKENEQSILVRVVNHFNMKHKKGANPRKVGDPNAIGASQP